MERVVIDGQSYVAKWLSVDLDWVLRATRDEVCRPVVMWASGPYDVVAAYVDPVVVGAARDEAAGCCILLMRDVADQFLPDGDAPITGQSQQQFLRDLAALHAGCWGFSDTGGLCPPMDWYAAFSRETVARETPANVGPWVVSDDDELKPRVQPPQIIGIAGDDAMAALPCEDDHARVNDVRRPVDTAELTSHAGRVRVEGNDLAHRGAEEASKSRLSTAIAPHLCQHTCRHGELCLDLARTADEQ